MPQENPVPHELGSEENTWEPLSNLGDTKEAIAVFVQEDKA